MIENKTIEYKSIQKIRTGDKGFASLSTTCVALANAQGGMIYIGFDDKKQKPETDVVLTEEEVNSTLTKLRSRCFNVSLSVSDILIAENGSHYLIITVMPSIKSIASTSDGKYYIRAGDKCEPVHSEDILRLANEKQSFQWELVCSRKVRLADVAPEKLYSFCERIRKSERVGNHIKQMNDREIALNYNLIDEDYLTYLGILWLGNAAQRSRISYPITVQYIVYDQLEQKIRKLDWHDNLLNPMELILDIERNALELSYSYEFPDGFFRKQVHQYHPKVIRELLLNSIAHKAFTISGDIMIEVYPDRLEISNPGGLPLGVTKENILHQRQRRNPHFIRIMHDIGLMEGEGSGYDLIYELNARDAKRMPIIESDFNYTKVIQYSEITNSDLLTLLDYVTAHYSLSQKNMIALGLVAQHQKILSTELSQLLQLKDDDRMRSYTESLVQQAILVTSGVKKGKAFIINPNLISNARMNRVTTLKTVEPYRLKELIREDLRHHPHSSMAQIASRLPDADKKDIRKFVYAMVAKGVLLTEGGTKNRTYFLSK